MRLRTYGQRQDVWTLLKGQSLSYFEHQSRRRLYAEDAELLDNYFLGLVIRDLGLECIPKPAIRVKMYYMRQGIYMGLNTI